MQNVECRTYEVRSAERGVGNPLSRTTHHAPCTRPPTPHSAHRTPHSEQGVALVITLVLLSIITFMAVAFLVVSHSQHGSVVNETDQAVARLATEAGRERALAQLITPILASTNEFNYGLLVSANYINPGGFISGNSNPTNVNYFDTRGAFLKPGPPNYDLEQNLANLLFDPRPPVFIVTNALAVKSNEFRSYLDLNRNGRDDLNGLQPVIVRNAAGALGYVSAKDGSFIQYQPSPPPGVVNNYFVGDPEWIGVLRHPEYPHSADNPFVARYAYIALPVGQSLDLNVIHNDAKRLDFNKGFDGFLRNQGALTAEINLAAFLADLNTNFWPSYTYNPVRVANGAVTENPSTAQNAGIAFEDASALLRYRYNGSLNSMASVQTLLPNAVNAFGRDYIDGYSAGPVMLGTWWPPLNPPQPSIDRDIPRMAVPWASADNPSHFYTSQDLFDQSKTRLPGSPPKAFSFSDRLTMAGTNLDSYNSYTFYRLLSQLGTDSGPEPGGKMNLNYCNVDTNGYVVPNAATNFVPWTNAAQFFTNAAIRLLTDAGYTVGLPGSTSNVLVLTTKLVNGTYIPITNLSIPIYPTNLYTPSVHRILQLAANIYDATTNRADLTTYPYLPTVFRPVFTNTAAAGGKGGGSSFISIVGYQELTDASIAYNLALPHDLTDPSDRVVKQFDMVYGIPLVIGAKKGFPNFNKLAMQTMVQVTRKLQFHRPGTSTSANVNEIDQMFVLGISNAIGVEAWNSYATPYPRKIQLVVWPDVSVLVTNLETKRWLNPPPVLSRWRLYPTPVTTNIAEYAWSGYNQTFPQASFQIPINTNLVFMPNMTYRTSADRFVALTNDFERQVGTTNFHVPHWSVKLKPRLRFAMVDTTINPNRIVDYVDLAADTDLDLTTALMSGGACNTPYNVDGSNGGMWCTNRDGTLDSIPTYGIRNQLEASLGHVAANWNASTHEFPAGMSKDEAVAFFKGQFTPGYLRSSNTFSTPFQPFRDMYMITSWQANDPLVHYTVADLTDLVRTNFMVDQLDPPPTQVGQVNRRYEPWGGNPLAGSTSPVKFDMTVKDPLMLRSDNWDFPTNKFPNVGWLGRVHRGTPWQTVYLKSFGVPNYPNWLKNWQTWTGNGQVVTNTGQLSFYLVGPNALANDAFFSQPTNDWHLLDLFTAALNDNATRGQLSVNQTNLAAWSAVLSGVMVFTNNLDANGNPIVDAVGNPVPGWVPIQPAGTYDPTYLTNWPPISRLINGVNIARFKSNPRHVFTRMSDLLATPELTTASPFLNTNNTPTLKNSGLNDAAYERLPQQIAGLLKADPVPRFVVYSFGQTLKPESTRAIVKSGPFAGICTNYQIVAESVTRTVVRFEGLQPNRGVFPPAITNLHPIIESFNVLSAD
jgi:hypothetical protein